MTTFNVWTATPVATESDDAARRRQREEYVTALVDAAREVLAQWESGDISGTTHGSAIMRMLAKALAPFTEEAADAD